MKTKTYIVTLVALLMLTSTMAPTNAEAFFSNKLKSTIASQSGAIDTLTQKVGDLQSKLATAQEAVDAGKVIIDKMQNEKSLLEATKETLQEKINELQKPCESCAVLKTKCATLEEKCTTLETKITELQETIPTEVIPDETDVTIENVVDDIIS